MELEQFLCHHSAQLSHLPEEGMENRGIGLGDSTMYGKNSCGFAPGQVANQIQLVPKSPGRVTALHLSSALSVYLEARTGAYIARVDGRLGFRLEGPGCTHSSHRAEAGCSQGTPLMRSARAVWLLPKSQAFHLCQVTFETTSDIIKRRNP